jgi:PAS domain S-box-containing protein
MVGSTEAPGDLLFRLMFERSADAILLLDTATNQFVEYNQATLDMLRCTRTELAALHPSELSPPRQPDGRESFEKANEMIATAVARGSHRFEWTHCSPHREEFPVEVLLTPLQPAPLGGDERPLVVVVWRDISERKRAEEALRQAQRLESLGVLAGGIAHDFNNLLTAVIGHLHLARSRAATDPTRAIGHLDTMEQALLRAADLTRQMLAYSGRGSFMIEPLDLGRVVRELEELLRVSIAKGVRLTSVIEPGIPAVEADRGQVHQVLMNLVTNASEAVGDAGGTITLSVRRRDLDAAWVRTELAGQAIEPGPYVAIEVRDTGQGMSSEVQGRIFDPFFSTKASGRGLGLSALLGILKAHRAGVRIQSAVGLGTSFEVVFPASSKPAVAPPEPAPAHRRSVVARGALTLLVDDEDLVRSSVRAVLENLGFSVLEAHDGREGVRLLAANAERIAWVLMDLTMAGLDGHAAFLEMQKIAPGIPVVLSSGWAEAEVSQRFAERRPAAFLAKPFTRHDLLAVLDRIGLGAPEPPA